MVGTLRSPIRSGCCTVTKLARGLQLFSAKGQHYALVPLSPHSCSLVGSRSAHVNLVYSIRHTLAAPPRSKGRRRAHQPQPPTVPREGITDSRHPARCGSTIAGSGFPCVSLWVERAPGTAGDALLISVKLTSRVRPRHFGLASINVHHKRVHLPARGTALAIVLHDGH